MAAVPINIRGRQADASLVDDLATMLDELYADVDGVINDSGSHNLLSDSHGDTTEGDVVRGDVITGQTASGATTWTRLALGATGRYLKSDGTDAGWAAIAETDITDGSLLARVGSNETITGTWTYNANPILGTGIYLQMNAAEGNIRLITGTSATVRIGDPVANNNTTITFYTGTNIRMTISNSAITAGTSIVFRGVSGSASAPSYSHTTDTDTGMYFDNSNGIYFSTGNAEKVRMTATGLSIGGVAATVLLDVFNSALALVTTPTVRLANTTAATSGATRQYSPALVFSGTGWDTDAGGSSKTIRNSLHMKTTTGTTVNSGLYLSSDEDGAGTFVEEMVMGRVASGESFRHAIRDGNLLFRNAGRGIFFTSAPMTDTVPTSHYYAGSADGRLDAVPGVGATEGYFYVEHNQASTTGTRPAISIRGFDDSTASPIITIRHRAVPGGTAAAGFGNRELYQASSTTTSNQDAGAFDCVWTDATHATRTAAFDFYLVNSAAALARKFRMYASGVFETSAATFMCQTSAALNNGAAAAAGTLTNAPSAGDPTKWIPINDNGTTRYIPAW